MRRGLKRDAIPLAAELARPVVALQTQSEDDRPFQKACIHRAVRRVTRLTSLNTHRGMLEHEGAALVGVAFHAGLFGRHPTVHHTGPHSHIPGGRGSAVRVVTICTIHEAFVYAMLGWHGELRAHRWMAGIAEGCLV